jgi:hypothetical protein
MTNAKLLSQVFTFFYLLSLSILYFNILLVFFNKKFLLAIQEFICWSLVLKCFEEQGNTNVSD